MMQQIGAEHRHEGQRNEGRDDDRGRQRNGEFVEQPADDLAHEEERDQHGDQRDGERNDGEADLRRALERRLQRCLALLDIARDVLDHHDGIVDDEAGRDRQRHQREIVEAEAEQIHDAERADERQRHRKARDDRRRQIAQKEEDDEHDQHDGEHELESTSATEARIVVVRSLRIVILSAEGRLASIWGSSALIPSATCDDIGAWLALDVEDDGRRACRPGGDLGIFRRRARPSATSDSRTGAPLR